MIGSINYSSPVMVNGFSCRNCSEVDQAKRNIDPADPAAGPFGLNSPKPATGKTDKAPTIDPAAIAQAPGKAAKHQGSHVHRAYGGTPVAGQLLQLSA